MKAYFVIAGLNGEPCVADRKHLVAEHPRIVAVFSSIEDGPAHAEDYADFLNARDAEDEAWKAHFKRGAR